MEAEIDKCDGRRQAQWTESIAVGSKAFLESVQDHLTFRARGRRKRPLATGMELRETMVPYNELFETEKEDIEPKNRYF